MKIEGIIWLQNIVEKLSQKHHVETYEVEEALEGRPKFRFVEKGKRKDENVFVCLGQSNAGRYLKVLFIYKQSKHALILSARDMEKNERRQYAKK